jgi:hypothetical protein
MRRKVRLSPITAKPARVRMFMPKRRSWVNIAPAVMGFGSCFARHVLSENCDTAAPARLAALDR